MAAGSVADQGDLGAAVRLLGPGFKKPARPAEHHLRRAYALADLLERSGEHISARELFSWVLTHDRDFGDTADRVASLG